MSDNKKPSFSSPLAKFSSFAAKNSNLLSTFNRVQSPSLPFGFSSRPLPTAAAKPSVFTANVSDAKERSVSGKSGGVEAVRLFVLGENDNRCLGAIGSSGEKFCTLMCVDGSQRCDIKSHSTKVDVESSCVFIRVPEQGRGKNGVADKLPMLQEKQFSMKAWNRIFSGFTNLQDTSEEAFNTLCQRSILEPQVPFTAMKKRRVTETHCM